ncbi:MAG TPA: SRPBCC domain-containing protein [Candidatus Limnocylindrales bacterium]|nr:SRPBCC domain-containing protein [Candidatus Limnocylindrales bacterium]
MDLRTKRTIRSAIEIRAPLDVVWRVLTDFAAYPDWNPHIKRVVGTPRAGTRITIHSQPPGGRTVVMRPEVIEWSPPNELRWRGTFISRRLFTGEHGFRVDTTATGRVRFTQDETFTGLLVPLYARLRMNSTRNGFDQVNEALRERAEAEAQAG